uniref:Ribosomal protein eL8/eL30/eS12/Gadd45 domain-containing protein n=1 Tax=Denticeps clupeoides TaxID=299321 RepID=A0AAY4BX63_9TELE
MPHSSSQHQSASFSRHSMPSKMTVTQATKGCVSSMAKMQKKDCQITLNVSGRLSEAISQPDATSWATVAKAAPKWSAPPSFTSLEERTEQTLDKKKRKKKRKSKVSVDETSVKTAVLLNQVLPKFEDEEEFPDLSSVSRQKGHGHNLTKQLKGDEAQSEDRKNAGNAAAVVLKKGKADTTCGKKTKAPVQLDLGNMVAVLEQKQLSQKNKQDQKKVTLSVGSALPVVPMDQSRQKKHPRKQEMVPHNPLDSTSPLVKKGKQREIPKAKKPTPLKRIILKEREERKQNRLLEEQGLVSVPSPEIMSEDSAESTMSAPDKQDTANECATGVDGDESEELALPKHNAPDQPKLHSRRFRDYCSQILSKDVDECVSTLLKELVRFQDRLYQKDPMKARMKRRLVIGLREVLKHLKLRKVKCVIITPNCERIQSKGGLDEVLHTIIEMCQDQGVPLVFALSRKALGRCVCKTVPVSLVGIFNYDGAQDHYHKMIELSSEARKAYEVMVANQEVTSNQKQELPPGEWCTLSSSDAGDGEDPAYITLWKKLLEDEDSYQFLNSEERFSRVSIGQVSEEATSKDKGS